jgi:serine protease
VHTFAKLSALAAVAGLLAACSGGVQPSIPTTQAVPDRTSSPSNVIVEDGVIMHTMPVFNGITGPVPGGGLNVMGHASSSGGNLLYKGGPVQHNPKIYIVFWGSNWKTTDPEYTRLVSFFNGLSGSQWNNTVTQYYDNSAHISNDATVGGTWIDTASVPSRPGSSAVASEAKRAESHFGYQGTDANYWVAIESGHDPSGFKTQWCAWHSSTSTTSGTISYTDFPYQSDAGASCGANSVSGTYDGVTIVGGHEEAETETDPQPSSGWVDSSGSEIGDKCAWTNLQNTSFSTGTFPTQPLWSNSAGGCVQ